MKKFVVTKETSLAEILNFKKGAETVFMGFGLHCFSCPMAQMDTVEDAARIHGVDLELLLKKLNELQ